MDQQSYLNARRQLDALFLFDSVASVVFGILSLLAPHGILTSVVKLSYDHNVHEALRLYACLRIAVGWILYHIRKVDDGKLRKRICESLCVCYFLQSAAVLRAQWTSEKRTAINWMAIVLLTTLGLAYARFRFGKGGDLIKVYELPTMSSRSQR